MAIVKSVDQIKVNSGNNFKIKESVTYETLGDIQDGKFDQTGKLIEGAHANGFEWAKRGSSKASLMITLSQVSSEIYKRIMELVGKTVSIYYHNGRDDAGEDMELYSNKATIIEQFSLDMGAGKVQVIGLNIALNPASDGVMTCVPDDDLPADAFAEGAVAVDSASPFIVMMNTPQA